MFFDAAEYCPKLRCTGYKATFFSVLERYGALWKNSFGALCTAICKRENHGIVKGKNFARSTRQGFKAATFFCAVLRTICPLIYLPRWFDATYPIRGSRSFTHKKREMWTVRKFLAGTEANRSALNKFRGFIHHGPSGWISHSLWDERDLINFELCWIRIG